MSVPALLMIPPTPAPIAYDFLTGTLPSGTTLTRASAANGFNSAGVLTSYAIDAPRFVYDPTTLASLGILVEGARTNSLRNSTMVGAVAASPGTLPTNWHATSSTSGNGLTRTVVGTGTEDGIEYIDIRWNGTASATQTRTLIFEAVTQIPAASGQIWTGSIYMRLMAGSQTTSITHFTVGETSGGVTNEFGQTSITPTSAALRTQRTTTTFTMASGLTAFVTNQLHMAANISSVIDITFRVGLPQLEQGDCATSPIKTSTVAVSRSADITRITNPRIFTDKAMFFRGRIAGATPATSVQQSFINFDDGTGNNRKGFFRVSSGAGAGYVITASVAQVNTTLAVVANNADFGMAARFEDNNFAISLNGAAVSADTACTMPTAVTQCGFGMFPAALTHPMNSTIRSIETRVTTSDTELVTLSGVVTDADALLWLQQVQTNGGSVSYARLNIVSAFITAEKAAGTWVLTDDYFALWGENAVQSLTSLKQRRLATVVAAPVHTPDRGYLFNGTTSYINSGFIPVTHAVTMTATNVRLASYERTDLAGVSTIPIGALTDTNRAIHFHPRSGGNLIGTRLNWDGVQLTYTPVPLTSAGYTTTSRNGPDVTSAVAYKNGVAMVRSGVTNPATYGASLPTQPFFIGAFNSIGTPTQFRAAELGFLCVGAQLSPAQELAQYDNVQAWAASIGAAV